MSNKDIFKNIEYKLNKEFIGQKDFFNKLCAYFENKFNNDENGILLLAGNKDTFKKASVRYIFNELKNNEVIENGDVDDIDLSEYSFKLGYNAFLTDLYEKLKVEHSKIKSKYLKQEEAFKKIKHEYEHMEEVYRKEQAGILAHSLRNGEACPVCGSLNHPNKAVNGNANIPTEEELKNKKGEFEKYQLENNNIMLELTKINSEANNLLENCNKSLSKLSNDISINPEYDFSSKEEVKNIGINLKSNIEVLNKEIKEDFSSKPNLFKLHVFMNAKYLLTKSILLCYNLCMIFPFLKLITV